ncbi:hypothetical protein AKJ37_07445 [candidate division MSBL1 archaeon SCGC-AAA259I09]|uniref:TATA-box-binding protein n=1 Tax=candidate division MSBL1 archaeon SCGC-AAA259I09 TaxID=1698267 RepID=A0A133UK95_9EURY|nr:hypothetical protein AKJ37_07445 [candidate division MSBL1 archaeon SCGC-AAA259I09]
MTDAEYEVNNIVLTVSYEDVELDLEKISSNLEGARYDPEVFPGVAYRTSKPKASFLIFASGEANCVGAKTVEGAEKAIEKLTEQLQDLGFDVEEPEIEVQNMVVSVDFDRRFDLEEIARNYHYAEYNPEVFPALVFRWEDTNVVILLFVEGEGVCVGAKKKEEIEKAIEWISETIESINS